MKAIDRTDLDAIHQFALDTAFNYDKRHSILPLVWKILAEQNAVL
jgi:hypothetical protein